MQFSYVAIMSIYFNFNFNGAVCQIQEPVTVNNISQMIPTLVFLIVKTDIKRPSSHNGTITHSEEMYHSINVL